MKIAYILYPEVIVSNKSNGVRSQAEDWAYILERHGHQVEKINNWENYNWKDYDIIHLFGDREWAYYVGKRIRLINDNVIYSPICDPSVNFKMWKEKVRYIIHYLTFGLYKWHTFTYKKVFTVFKSYLVRSVFEGEFIKKIYEAPSNDCTIVRLGYSSSCKPYESVPKENFCLHISSIYQPRKNVLRLIEAAKKYNFNLILAGNKGSDIEFEPIRKTIGDSDNIKVLGFISEEEKIELYKRAKVFALPSLNEGVGIVALDAAYYGCEIAITSIPGPKEYYKGKCVEVDPMDINSIGQGIKSLMSGDVKYQPELATDIKKSFSQDTIYKTLIDAYKSVL